MLHRLSADHTSFKTIVFREGLNIVLADRQAPDGEGAETPERRTRNGAGKSSIIDLIHFLLAGSAEGAIKSKVLADWSFDLSLDVGTERISVRRGSGSPRVFIGKDSGAVSDAVENTTAAWANRLGHCSD